jgi:hypothetical protein
MDPLHHSSADVPAPSRKRGKLRLNHVPGVLMGLGIVVFLVLSIVFKRRGEGSGRTEALNNIRQLGMSLFEFDSEYGQFPDASTIAMVKEDTGTDLDLGDASSNEIFRQLIAVGLKSEQPFYFAISTSKARKPDNIITRGRALEPGECTLGYVVGQTSLGDPSCPVVFGPVMPGTRRFDPKPFKGKAIILRLDNSAIALEIDPKTGQVMQNGMDIFDPRQSWWGGEAPDIKLPE